MRWLLSIDKIHSQCHSMKIFPLRANLEIFFLPEMAAEMPTRLCEHQMQKEQNPRLVWLGWQMGSKTTLEIQPWCCQIFPDKATSWCFSHLPRELLPSFPPFCLSRPSGLSPISIIFF